MKESLCELWQAITKPEIRHKTDHECGLYASENASTPLAALKFKHDCAMPLYKIFAIIGMTIIFFSAVWSIADTLKCLVPCRKGRFHTCRCD
ncbi:MAG: hypothetical protein IKW66_01765 [Clostridia bacterium]|nr:hypothetical protein [Clostridia bacterium]